MVLTELIQNAAQHAYPDPAGPGVTSARGGVSVAANRIRDRLRVRVSDDGVGMPEGIDSGASLGLSIVKSLVESELNGTLRFDRGQRGGTTVTIELEV